MEEPYSEARFYFITDNEDYCTKSAYANTSMPFGLNGEKTCSEVPHPLKGSIKLGKKYDIPWERYKYGNVGEVWYFLEMQIH